MTGITYFRSRHPDDITSFEMVEEVYTHEIIPFEVPGFALGFGGSPALGIDDGDNVALLYSDRSLYQSGLTQDIWPDAGMRGTLYIKRYLRDGSGWTATPPKVVARGTYGDVDLLVDGDGTVHVVYTIVYSGSDYRIAYRRISPDDQIGEEILLTQPDSGLPERTIHPAIARLGDGALAVTFTDRFTQPNGNLGIVVRPTGSDFFGCVGTLTAGTAGAISSNTYPAEYEGDLLLVYLTGTSDPYTMMFGKVDTASLMRSVSE